MDRGWLLAHIDEFNNSLIVDPAADPREGGNISSGSDDLCEEVESDGEIDQADDDVSVDLPDRGGGPFNLVAPHRDEREIELIDRADVGYDGQLCVHRRLALGGYAHARSGQLNRGWSTGQQRHYVSREAQSSAVHPADHSCTKDQDPHFDFLDRGGEQLGIAEALPTSAAGCTR
ncbi:hypothetical protein GCM10009617_35970 [Leifsonia poae]